MKALKRIVQLLIILTTVTVALAQKSTEMFIPIGQSPGLSGAHTLYGEVESINVQEGSCVIKTPDGKEETIITDGDPDVWLDYSSQKQKNTYGSLSDIKLGMTVECKFIDNQKRDSLDWIKVAMKKPR